MYRIIEKQSKKDFKNDFGNYLMSKKAYWYWSIFGITIISIFSIIFINENETQLNLLRQIFGVILIILLPGYSFIRLLFPKKESIQTDKNWRYLKPVERIGLSLIFSLVLISILAIFLNYLIGYYNLDFVIIILISITQLFSALAIFLEYQQL